MRLLRTLPEMTQDEVARFWSHVSKAEPAECWLWSGALTKRGYGTVKVRNVMWGAHRVAFLLAGGLLTAERPMVLHSCVASRACCNPLHLRAGTQADNTARWSVSVPSPANNPTR